MNLCQTIKSWLRDNNAPIPVAEWALGDDGREYKLALRETDTHPRLFICRTDVDPRHFYTMDPALDGGDNIYTLWRPQ